MTKKLAVTQEEQQSQAGPTVEEEFATREAKVHLGLGFHRFQELKKSNLPEAGRCFLEFKAGLIRRMEWEEETLFPGFERKLGAAASEISVSLRREHDQIREHLNAIESKLARHDPDTSAEESALEAVLDAHNHREHEAVYPVFET